MAEKVRDLRSALALLEQMPDQLIETEVEVDPMAELAGVYRYVGAGGTVKRDLKSYKRTPGCKSSYRSSGKQKKSCCFT